MHCTYVVRKASKLAHILYNQTGLYNAAIILERVVGYDVSKPVSKATFCDVHYLQQMLHSVFTALHRAQRQLAFHHADLRLANIMEAVPSAYGDQTPDISMTPRTGTLQAAALFDSQHVSGVLQHIPSSLDTPIHSSSSSKQLTGSKSLAPIDNDQPQMSQNAFLLQSLRPKGDASLVSQSSAARFKMIDFGLADFRETYGAGYVTEKHDTLVHRQPHRQPSLQSLPVSDDKVSSSTVHSSDTACCSSDAAGAQQHNRQEPAGCSSSNARSRIEWISDDRPERRASRKFFPVPAALLPEVSSMPCVPLQSICISINVL